MVTGMKYRELSERHFDPEMVRLELTSRFAYLETLKRAELLAKKYVAKRFGEKCDFMAHAHLVLSLFLLDYGESNSNQTFQTHGKGAVMEFYLVYIPYSKCMVYML